MSTPSHTPTRPERELVDALRRGDEDAYAELVDAYGPKMHAVTRRFLRDEEEANDAYQDALLSAFRGIDRFDGRSKLSTWLHRIAVNAALMRKRTKDRRVDGASVPLSATTEMPDHLEERSAGWVDPHQAAQRSELGEIVRGCIRLLPERYREVIELRDLRGLDTLQASQVLGGTPNATKIRLHRARAALLQLLVPALAG